MSSSNLKVGKALGRSHEIGLFVNDWPSESVEHWNFDYSVAPMLTGVSQLLEAQKHVNVRAANDDPARAWQGLASRL